MSKRCIDYTIAATPLGRLLLAASERGVCFVAFGPSAPELRARLESEFPFAPLARNDERLRAWGAALSRCAAGEGEGLAIPLDVSGSRFQQRVWAALREIPRGQTRSYGELARALGMPRGARAVARACATNPVPLLVPCHRAVARDGPGGYAWGVARKRALLRAEQRSPERAGGQGPWREHLEGDAALDLPAPASGGPPQRRGPAPPARGVDRAGALTGSRCTVSGEKAGRHTATYSAPPGAGLL